MLRDPAFPELLAKNTLPAICPPVQFSIVIAVRAGVVPAFPSKPSNVHSVTFRPEQDLNLNCTLYDGFKFTAPWARLFETWQPMKRISGHEAHMAPEMSELVTSLPMLLSKLDPMMVQK